MDSEPLTRAYATAVPLLDDERPVIAAGLSRRSLWLSMVASVLVLALACVCMVVLAGMESVSDHRSVDQASAHPAASRAMLPMEYTPVVTHAIEDRLADTLSSILTSVTRHAPWHFVEDNASEQLAAEPTPTVRSRTRVRKRGLFSLGRDEAAP